MNSYILKLKIVFFTGLILFPFNSFAWEVDMSRRQSQMGKKADLAPEVTDKSIQTEEKGLVERVLSTVVPTQDIVILNTEQGFIPSVVRVKEGAQYRIVVVNVNEKSRNVSFVLDAFSEHHATFYGKLKTFYISPKKDGVYSFISPETSAQGRLIVYPSAGTGSVGRAIEMRSPASE